MRIIGGEARGRTLVAPAGKNTRPTQDYVRESLFNILQGRIEDVRVLDLFAGTGALALESLSRGAASAVLVDMDRAALSCIRRNIESVGVSERCRVLARDCRSALSQLQMDGEVFDLVFLDPPYKMTQTGELTGEMERLGLLAQEVLLVIEHRKGQDPHLPDGFEAYRKKQYGDTEITFVRRREET